MLAEAITPSFAAIGLGGVSARAGVAMYRMLAVASIIVAAALSNAARADISIAVAAPMTGTNAWAGEQLQRGAEMAVADINAAGGVLGQQVRLITADDFCDPQQAIATAFRMIRSYVWSAARS